MKPESFFVIVLIFNQLSATYANSCLNKPEIPTTNENRYMIEISGNPEGYVPDANYIITLKLHPSLSDFEFTSFILGAESMEGKLAGNFQLIDPLHTTFSSECPLTVIQTSAIGKRSIKVSWQAPPDGSGCVQIKAIVYENINDWYKDGDLTKILCQGEEDTLPEVLEVCNACHEAKYEIGFQGTWCRNTHPKGFPLGEFTTKLGDIIGASHKYSKAFWNQGTIASDGLQLLAETGNTSLLETELKTMLSNEEIRTIFKARELAHPMLTGTSYTVFRVDSENHLISVVSKITPSPDWIVGVADLDLCLKNGSWATSYTFNLYPWDVGTDDGLSYESPDQPSDPKQVIRLITSNFPNKEESPFYDPDGGPIKPLAKLHLFRKKLYEKDCKTEEENNVCPFSEWSEWSSCSVACGKGVRTRDREIRYDTDCTPDETEPLQENEECEGEEVCEDEGNTEEEECSDAIWEKWSPCSVTCGNGTKTRLRKDIEQDEDHPHDKQYEEDDENECKNVIQKVTCYNPPCVTDDIEPEHMRNVNNGNNGTVVVDCEVSKWSIWTSCDMSLPCKKRYKYQERYILTPSQNGGRPCPKKLKKKRKCKCNKKRKPSSRSKLVFKYNR